MSSPARWFAPIGWCRERSRSQFSSAEPPAGGGCGEYRGGAAGMSVGRGSDHQETRGMRLTIFVIILIGILGAGLAWFAGSGAPAGSGRAAAGAASAAAL